MPSLGCTGMTHQLDVERVRIAMVNIASSSLDRLSNVTEDFRQINCGVPLRIGRSTMLKWNSRSMTSFAEATGD